MFLIYCHLHSNPEKNVHKMFVHYVTIPTIIDTSFRFLYLKYCFRHHAKTKTTGHCVLQYFVIENLFKQKFLSKIRYSNCKQKVRYSLCSEIKLIRTECESLLKYMHFLF